MKATLRKCLFTVIAVSICQAISNDALAWSSKKDPLFEPIHQMAIENVLKSQVNPATLKILTDQQPLVDQHQKPQESYEHAMTGLEKAGQTVAMEKPIYRRLSEEFIRTNLSKAIQARRAGSYIEAFTALGQAIHPLQDATSPAHEGFQPWSYNESYWAIAEHISKERSYPSDSRKTWLEGVVQYAFDIYMEKVPLPASFFGPDDKLILPGNYLNP